MLQFGLLSKSWNKFYRGLKHNPGNLFISFHDTEFFMLRILTVLCFASCDSVRDERILEFKELSVALTSLSKPEFETTGISTVSKVLLGGWVSPLL